jgi:hypothetical protein
MAMGYDADVVHKENNNSQIGNTQELAMRNFTMREAEQPIDLDELIQRMRLVHGSKNDTELTAALGISRSATSNWRNRNSPPYEICVDLAREKGVSLDWLIFGVGDMRLGTRGMESRDLGQDHASSDPSPIADSISRFVYWWHVNRSAGEMTWLEHQLKRAVPEYAEWLANPATVVAR